MIIFAISIGFGVWIGWMVYKFVKKYVLHSADAKKTSIQIK
jgi:hypothetical protein